VTLPLTKDPGKHGAILCAQNRRMMFVFFLGVSSSSFDEIRDSTICAELAQLFQGEA